MEVKAFPQSLDPAIFRDRRSASFSHSTPKAIIDCTNRRRSITSEALELQGSRFITRIQKTRLSQKPGAFMTIGTRGMLAVTIETKEARSQRLRLLANVQMRPRRNV